MSKTNEEVGFASALRAGDAVEADVRDAAWQAYLAEDEVSAAIDAAIRAAVALTVHRWDAVRERVLMRHARRPDGHCVMCRWSDGSLVRHPCPDYLDAQSAALSAIGTAGGGQPNASDLQPDTTRVDRLPEE